MGWGEISYYPSLNDKNDRNDKETEKSSMRVIGGSLPKRCHSCHSCHGNNWAVECRVACAARCPLTWQLGRAITHPAHVVVLVLASDAKGQPLPVASCTITHLLIALCS
jgi:hypothetical protein